MFDGKSMETETNTWLDFPNGWKAIIEQILALEKINPKVQDCKSQSGIQVGKLAIWVRSFEIHKLFTEAPSLPEVRLTLLNTNPVFQCFEPSVSMPQGKKIISWKFIFKFCEVFHNICSFDFHLQSKFIVIINIILSSCNIIFLVVINNHLSRIY